MFVTVCTVKKIWVGGYVTVILHLVHPRTLILDRLEHAKKWPENLAICHPALLPLFKSLDKLYLVKLTCQVNLTNQRKCRTLTWFLKSSEGNEGFGSGPRMENSHSDRHEPLGSFCRAFCGAKACGAKPHNMSRGEPHKKIDPPKSKLGLPKSSQLLRRFLPGHIMLEIFYYDLYRDSARLLGESYWQKNRGATRGKNPTKIPSPMFSDQEPGGRGPPLKNHHQNWSILGVVLQGGSSSSGFLIWKPLNKETPPGGNVSFNQSVHWESFVFLEGDLTSDALRSHHICEEGHYDQKMQWDPVK